MKYFILTPLITSLACIWAGRVSALPIREVYSQDAQGISGLNVELKVHSGYGLTINFISTGEKIKQIWIGDPSHFAFTSNGGCTHTNAANQECSNENATVLFLRQIKPINFPNLIASKDGSTQLTVITSDDSGQQKQYLFRLIPASGKPAYTSLVIKPDSQKPQPLLLETNIKNRRNR
ncbi:hypothetical protein [Fischerella thermalis]|uniref:Uncharacterized protein n=1 Tax=Fischerella thermalis CCMEE 5318 TaxID=2019666 RepID=A0A2N6LP93_9CYAN|nr:hypothetical protein [Fischerella thermalis]PMB27576.1 hypothetical protein CEN46_01160 [Fischerella thermalis CCMEE 5318]